MKGPSENDEHEVFLESPVALDGDQDWPADVSSLARFFLTQLILDEGLSGRWQLSLTITDDAGIRVINQEWRDKDGPTDVLSFPQYDFWNGVPREALSPGADPSTYEGFPGPESILLGDIVISFETCRRQGREVGHGTQSEFLRLLVHGLLHLVGYDHERSAEEEKIMQRREDELLNLTP